MSTLPEGPGLAAKFPHDQGIGQHPAVILTENFERGTRATLSQKWSDIPNKAGKPLALETIDGRRALKITATLGENNGGHLFARFYVRFEPDADYLHHFVWRVYRTSIYFSCGSAENRRQ